MVLQALYSGFASMSRRRPAFRHSRPLGTVSADRHGVCFWSNRQACAQDFAQQNLAGIDVLPGHLGRNDVAAAARAVALAPPMVLTLPGWSAGPRIELAADGPLDDRTGTRRGCG